MSISRRHQAEEEVEHLLLNARLRDELEPLLDESIGQVDFRRFSTAAENEYLASMLAWERAPIVSIAQWFEPELILPRPDLLSDEELREKLYETARKLYQKRIVLDFTDHLTDRQLYCIIYRDILPAPEKKLDSIRHFLHWDCAYTHDDPETWLRYYAGLEDRRAWQEETGEPLPPREAPPYRRELPKAPL